MFMSLVHTLEEAAAANPAAMLYGPLINVGAVGVCLIALALYFRQKDIRYELRIDERLKREIEFNQKYVELVEKQHTITEKFSATLATVVTLMQQSLNKA